MPPLSYLEKRADMAAAAAKIDQGIGKAATQEPPAEP